MTLLRERPFRLADIAPRLAKARDQHNERVRVQRVERWKARDTVLHCEQRVAHRELQLVRAQATGSGRYIAERERKLARAVDELRRSRAWADRIGATSSPVRGKVAA